MERVPVLALVLARGGSKRIPRKNLCRLGGHPLVAWAIAGGLQSTSVVRTICSTDDPEIARVARKYGAETPFMRPEELAGDDVRDLPVIEHALQWLQEHDNWTPEIVVHLRPSIPFRKAEHIDSALQMLLEDSACTCVRSVSQIPQTPFKMWRFDAERSDGYMTPLFESLPGIDEPYNAPRQLLPAVYWHNGVVDAIRVTTIHSGSITGGRIRPLVVEPEFTVDIDTQCDLLRARAAAGSIDCVRPRKLWGRKGKVDPRVSVKSLRPWRLEEAATLL